MDVMDMICNEIKKILIEYNGNLKNANLTNEEIQQINNHILSCKKCITYLQSIHEINEVIKSDVKVPTELKAKIMQKITNMQQNKTKVIVNASNKQSLLSIVSNLLNNQKKLILAFSIFFIVIVLFWIINFSYYNNTTINKTTNALKNNKLQFNEHTIKQNTNYSNKFFMNDNFNLEKGNLDIIKIGYKADQYYQVNNLNNAIITYKNVAKFEIISNSKFKTLTNAIVLKEGSIYADILPKSLKNFKIYTPHCVVEVTGTIFNVYVNVEKTKVSVKHGQVKIKSFNSKEEYILNANDEKIIYSEIANSNEDEIIKNLNYEINLSNENTYNSITIKNDTPQLDINSYSQTHEINLNETCEVQPFQIHNGSNIKNLIENMKK